VEGGVEVEKKRRTQQEKEKGQKGSLLELHRQGGDPQNWRKGKVKAS